MQGRPPRLGVMQLLLLVLFPGLPTPGRSWTGRGEPGAGWLRAYLPSPGGPARRAATACSPWRPASPAAALCSERRGGIRTGTEQPQQNARKERERERRRNLRKTKAMAARPCNCLANAACGSPFCRQTALCCSFHFEEQRVSAAGLKHGPSSCG